MSPQNPDWMRYPFEWPSLDGQRVLFLGIGGGSDVISAYVVRTAAAIGTPEVAYYGNTKSRSEADWQWITPNIARLPSGITHVRRRNGTTYIDRRVPRDEVEGPLIVHLPKAMNDWASIGGQLQSLQLDHVFAVDTGGDSLAIFRRRRNSKGRDCRMLRCLLTLAVPVQLLVVGLGADGDIAPNELAQLLASQLEEGRFLGRFSLEPMRERLEYLSDGLPTTKTPRIVLEAFRSSLDSIRVPRGQHPDIPRGWLTSGFAFRVVPGLHLQSRPTQQRKSPSEGG